MLFQVLPPDVVQCLVVSSVQENVSQVKMINEKNIIVRISIQEVNKG